MKRSYLLAVLALAVFAAGYTYKDQDLVLKAKLIFNAYNFGVQTGSVVQVQTNLANALMIQDNLGNNILGVTSTSGATAILQFYPETLSGATGITANVAGTQVAGTLICATTEMALVATVGGVGASVTLPASPYSGQHCMLKNQSATSMNLFPGTGGTLCVSGASCGAANAAQAVATHVQLDCYAEPPGGAASTWDCR